MVQDLILGSGCRHSFLDLGGRRLGYVDSSNVERCRLGHRPVFGELRDTDSISSFDILALS